MSDRVNAIAGSFRIGFTGLLKSCRGFYKIVRACFHLQAALHVILEGAEIGLAVYLKFRT